MGSYGSSRRFGGRIKSVKESDAARWWYGNHRKQNVDLKDEEACEQPEPAETRVSSPKRKVAPVKDDGICPMCEQPAVIHKLYEKNTYNVRGEEITVRESVFRCTRCGEKWANTKDGQDGLLKAYTVYVKRKRPEVRKFRKVTFDGGSIFVKICEQCAREYGIKDKAVRRINVKRTCYSKGCKGTTSLVVSLGKL